MALKKALKEGCISLKCARQDLNLKPSASEADAISIKLRAQKTDVLLLLNSEEMTTLEKSRLLKALLLPLLISMSFCE